MGSPEDMGVPPSGSGQSAEPEPISVVSAETATVPNAEIPEKRRAPEGMIWRCAACGKEAEDLYGMIGARTRGWDESCMLNAFPVPAESAK
jgi:hypothetical protein